MVYKQTESFTCGPSSFIEIFHSNKTKKEELKLHEIGRIKPSRIFLGVSFLELNNQLYLYTENSKLTKGILNLVFNPQVDDFNNKIIQYYNSLISKHKTHIIEIEKNEGIIFILKQAIQKNKNALFLSDSSYWLDDGGIHWISLKGQDDNGNFLFGDSITGKILSFTKKDILRILKLVKKRDFSIQIITDFLIL